jgi:hypothetical protein
MTENIGGELSVEDMENEYAAELPARELMIGISLLGIPLASLDGVTLNVTTAGPNWLFGSVGSVG